MIHNVSKKKVIAYNPVYAVSFVSRGRGMIGRKFSGFDAMIFQRCNSIHTLFMSITIDLVFVDRDNCVCAVYPSLTPWKPLVRCGKANTVIELPDGTIGKADIQVGDFIDLNAEVTDDEKKKVGVDGLQATEVALPYKRD